VLPVSQASQGGSVRRSHLGAKLHDRGQMGALQKLIRFARKNPREQLRSVHDRLANTDLYWKIRSPGNQRTAYVTGLYGTGRQYVNELILQNIGERAIYSCHATLKYFSPWYWPPAATSRILEAVGSGFADLIFVYRHPLDSLLSNWVFVRTSLKEKHPIYGTAEVYKTTDDLCPALEQNFAEFKAFTEGFSQPSTRDILSFPQFVEETELFIRHATLSLRMEDFMIDPLREFFKVAEVMSVDLDRSQLRLLPPRAKPYGYLAVQENVPRFRDFISDLDLETRRRIEKIGYNMGI
jgi:hypothetical protein